MKIYLLFVWLENDPFPRTFNVPGQSYPDALMKFWAAGTIAAWVSSTVVVKVELFERRD